MSSSALPIAEFAEQKPGTNQSPMALAWGRFRRHKLAMIGVVLLLLIILVSYGAPLFTQNLPNAVTLQSRNRPPDAEHLFGTDLLGRDVFARTLYGGRVSLSVGLAAAFVSITIGMALGIIAGYYGKVADMIVMRATDVMMTFPPIVIMMTLATFLGQGLWTVILIIGGLRWPTTARLIRAQMLSLKEKEFVQAARAIGLPDSLIIVRHCLPNTIAPLMANITFTVSAAILAEAGLSFLGLGIALPTPTWGNMMQDARNLIVLRGQPWMWMPAAGFTLFTILSINFIGDGLRDAFDPQHTR